MDPTERSDQGPRWQYAIVWRYGALLLAAVGLALLGVGASGLSPTAISVTMLPLGFLLLAAGVVLPRIQGKFTAGPTALTADILRVDEIDPAKFTATALATAPLDVAIEGEAATVGVNAPTHELIKLGDVWDAFDNSGFHPVRAQAALGTAYLEGPDGQKIRLPNKTFMDWAAASDDLLAILASWGVKPVASGNYPVPAGVDLKYATQTRGERDPRPPSG